MSTIINNDFMVYIHQKYNAGYVPKSRDAAIEDIRESVRRYRGMGVSDIIFNPNAQLSYTPSEIWEYAEKRYQRTEVDGIPVDFKQSYFTLWHTLSVTLDIDLYEIFTEETILCGMRPWLSFRLNDVHDSFSRTGELRRSDYTHTARREGRVRCRHHERCGYYDDALDLGLEEAEKRFLAYVDEQLSRYDTYGVELDLMREPFSFRPGYEDDGREILRRMLMHVRESCDRKAQRTGHPVKVAIRTFRSPEDDYYAGFDTPSLAREGLVDLVTVTPRWESCDSGMPVGLWRSVLPSSVRLAAGTDVLYRTSAVRDAVYYTKEQLYGLANQYYAEGADDIYLFNYEYWKEEGSRELTETLLPLTDPASLPTVRRRNIVSYQDICSIGGHRWAPLPIALNHIFSYLRVSTGRSEGSLWLLLGVEHPERLEVYVNSERACYVGTTETEKSLYKGVAALFEIKTVRPSIQMLELRTLSEGDTLSYVEIRSYNDPM